jgi:hypothetical protein
MRIGDEQHSSVSDVENKTETYDQNLSEFPAFVSPLDIKYNHSEQLSAQCSYVIAEGWHYGEPAPFCDAPTAPGSSYCAEHRALCAVPLGSVAATRVLAAQAHAARGSGTPPPPPEPLDLDADEALNALDLPRRDAAGGEG